MKILVVSPYFYPEGGGLERYVYNVFTRIAKKNHEVIVLSATKSGKDIHEKIDNIEVFRIKPRIIFSNTPIYPTLLKKIKEIVESREVDIINSHMPVPYFADTIALYKKYYNPNIPVIVTYHNDVIKEKFPMSFFADMYNTFFLKNVFETSDLIITPSPYCYYESQYLLKYNYKTFLVPPGVDLEKFNIKKYVDVRKYLNLPEDSKIVLFVGVMEQYHSHKGVDILIRAFKNVVVNDKNSFLVLVGKGNMVSYYKSLATSLKISDRVLFVGFIPDYDLPNYYLSSDIVVLPSTNPSEGFGMTLLEAGAAKKPVIGTLTGGIKYVIQHEKTGLLVPPRNSQQLGDAILHLLSNEKLRKKMGKRWGKIVRAKYRWDIISQATINVFEHALHIRPW